jgi:hypothetical protein
MTIHLYKLVSGETVIAKFFDEVCINDNNNTLAYKIANPLIIDRYHNMSPWINGCVSNSIHHVSLKNVMVMVEENLIDKVLVERYGVLFPDNN